MDGDTDLEIVVVSSDGKVYAWHHDGRSVEGWPTTTGITSHFPSPAIGDIDGDGDIEVVIGGDKIYAWHHNGTLDAVSELCEQDYRGVKSVITYNYDNWRN